MRTRWLARVLFALVAIQLAFGLQVSVADAHSAAPGAAAHNACQQHVGAEVAGTHPSNPQRTPGHRHDCCKTSDCQGHCSTVPLAFNLTVPGGVPAAQRILAVLVTRAANTRAETHFRPPIAS